MIVTNRVETTGINIFLDKKEAMILQYVLNQFELNFILKQPKIKLGFNDIDIKGHFLSIDLAKLINDKLKED